MRLETDLWICDFIRFKKSFMVGFIFSGIDFFFLFCKYCISLFAYWYHIRSTAFFKNITFARNVLQILNLLKQTIEFDWCHFSHTYSFDVMNCENVRCWWFSIISETFIQVPVPVFDTFWRATIKSIYRKMKLSKLSVFVLNSILVEFSEGDTSV